MAQESDFSSKIDWITYLEEEQTLQVNFFSGTSCRYSNVPKDVYLEFLESDSDPTFFKSEIRGKFQENPIIC